MTEHLDGNEPTYRCHYPQGADLRETFREALEPLATASGARHASDAVAGVEQLADGAPPDDAGGSGDHDLVHAGWTRYATRT